jgi:hypothetical protein
MQGFLFGCSITGASRDPRRGSDGGSKTGSFVGPDRMVETKPGPVRLGGTKLRKATVLRKPLAF